MFMAFILLTVFIPMKTCSSYEKNIIIFYNINYMHVHAFVKILSSFFLFQLFVNLCGLI